jgi:flagellar motor switch protein FliN/FliY
MSDEDMTTNEGDVADDWSAALAEQAESEGQQGEPEMELPRAQFEELGNENVPPADESANMNVILDIPVQISMEIGRTKISIRNLLQLNQGSVVELDRLAGEPLDVLVNGTLIAHGEVVVINEKYGIRLTDVISAAERVKKLA